MAWIMLILTKLESLLTRELKLNKHWYSWCPHTDSNREPTDYKSVIAKTIS